MHTRPSTCCSFVRNAAVATAIPLLAVHVHASAQEQESIISQVIVTAERRPLDMQTIPLSVSALTADDVRSFNMSSTVFRETGRPCL